jgi:TolB-like protein
MVAGRRPFEDATMMDVIAAILDREPAPLDLRAPVELQRIVSRALRKGLEERYQTSGEMLGDLKALRLNLEIAGSEKILAKRAVSAIAPPFGFLKRRWKVATLILAIALAAIGGYFYLNREAVIESLAVLPFNHASAVPDSEYLSEGLTEGLIYRLSELPRLRVIARRSVYGYKGDTTNPEAVGHALGVQYLLTGKIARRNDRLEISVELMDVRDNRHVWGGQYSYGPADIAAAQGEIAREVAHRLRPELTLAAQQRLARRATQNSQAYELYLKGRYFWNKRTPDGIKRALDYLQQSASEDPKYAVAYAGLADAWITASDYTVHPAREAYPKAKDAAEKALALDNTLAEAHTSLAMIRASYDWVWPVAEASFLRAINLNPSYPTAHQWYAEYLAGMGRHAEALAEIRKAQRLDPVSLVFQSVEAWVLYYARDYDGMIAQCQRTLDLDPNFAEAHVYLMRAYEQKGMYRQAMDAYQKWATLSGWSDAKGEAIRRAPVSGYADYWRKRVELERLSENIAPFNLAEALAQLDEKPEERDQAFALLDRCFAERDYHLMYLKVHPNLDRLRSDARFAALLRRVGLPVEK